MSSVLFRLRHAKLAKSSMGLAPLLRDAADEIERLQRLLGERRDGPTELERAEMCGPEPVRNLDLGIR